MNAPEGSQISAVAAAFGLGQVLEIQPLGGTAAKKWNVLTELGRFVIRRRPDEFADQGSTEFDHAVLRRLNAAGFPVPCPIAAPGGKTALVRGNGTYEVLHWIEGGPFPEGDAEAIGNVGSFLARLHQVLEADFPAGKEGRLREDHPDLMMRYVAALSSEADGGQKRPLRVVQAQVDLVRRNLDSQLYAALPQTVIHGDFHPGNVRFLANRVAALYDFDYVSVQARVRDLSDALMFFASRRRQPLDADDIRSLTQPFVPEAEPCRWLLTAYQEVNRLTQAEWDALPWLIRSRWLQMRLRGSRKVPPAEKVPFVLDGMHEVIHWLNRDGQDFFESLIMRGS